MGSGPGGGDEIVGLVGFWDLIVRVDLNRDLVGPLVDGKDITGKSVTPAIGVIDDTLVGEGTSGLGLAVDDFFNGEVGGGGRAVFDKVLVVSTSLWVTTKKLFVSSLKQSKPNLTGPTLTTILPPPINKPKHIPKLFKLCVLSSTS